MGSFPSTLANAIRGSILLVAGVLTDSEDAISLGKRMASGTAESESSSSRGIKAPTDEELQDMQEELVKWKAELSKARTESPDSDDALFLEELEKREAELKNIELKHKQMEDDVRNYPMPAFLEKSVSEGKINIAVVGNSGVGKSLLINSLRGVKSGDPHWAPVGVNETTTEPKMYDLPGDPNTRLWDLAGAGSQQFPRGSYTHSIGLRHFEMVIVVTTCRFTQTEVVLLSELDEQDVPSFVVRTMVDIDIASNRADHGMSEEETKRGIIEDLHNRGVPNPYLVNARKPADHDFRKLVRDLLNMLHDTKSATWEGRGRRSARMSEPIVKFEVGEMAEVWSAHFQLWVKCIIESFCTKSDEYNIFVPAAPADAKHVSNVSALSLRKAFTFEPGDHAEVVVVQGPMAGMWVKCNIDSRGDKPDTYNINVPDAPFGKRDIPNVHSSALRKAVVDTGMLTEILEVFKEVASKREFQNTLNKLRDQGKPEGDTQKMMQTFIAHQFNPTLTRFNIPATPSGWTDLLTFVKTQDNEAMVVKLAHEIEQSLHMKIGALFGIKHRMGIQADTAGGLWNRRIKAFAKRVVQQHFQKGQDDAEARASMGSPTSTVQNVTANHEDPMDRSVQHFIVSPLRWMGLKR